MKADIIFLAHNRREFTQIALEELLKNTNPKLVDQLVVIDDCSTDATREWLSEVLPRERRLKVSLHLVSYGAVVPVMNHGIKLTHQPLLAKIDNDTVVPPRWLDASISVMRRRPELGMLGIDAKNEVRAVGVENYGYTRTNHIGGIGVFRRSIFRTLPKQNVNPHKSKYHGFTEWQWAQRNVIKGWIHPGIPVILLDRVPVTPFPQLVEKYRAAGCQRGCGPYEPNETFWKWRFH